MIISEGRLGFVKQITLFLASKSALAFISIEIQSEVLWHEFGATWYYLNHLHTFCELNLAPFQDILENIYDTCATCKDNYCHWNFPHHLEGCIAVGQIL